jgi:hypothetical protein
MARQNIAGLLTGISSTQKPNPNASAADWRMQFGQQQAGRLGSAVRGVQSGLLGGAPVATPQEAMQMGLGKLDLGTVEGLSSLARVQQLSGDIAGAAQTAARIKQMQEQENKAEATVSYVEAVFPDKPELVDLAKKGISIAEIKSIGKGEKDYAVVGNSVYIPSTGEFIQGPKTKSGSAIKPNQEFNEDTGQNELVWREPTDPTVVLKRVKAPVDTAGVTATVEKIMKENRETEQAERATELEATTLANEYEKLLGDVNSGIFKTIEEGYKAITGRQDKLTSLYLAADRLRVGRGVKNLPVGPASDKDVALVMQGELPANASPEEIVRYARGVAKLARIARQDAALETSWYDRYGDARGLGAQREKERLEESFVDFPEGAIAELEADMSDEAIKEFNEAFQVDYLDMRTKLKRANKTLEELNRGF